MSAALRAKVELLLSLAEEVARDLEAIGAADYAPIQPGPVWISVQRAAVIAGRSEETIRTWAKVHKLGHKLGKSRSARWVIDDTKLRAYQAQMSVAAPEDSR